MDLEELRTNIRETDDEIMELIKKRTDIAEKVGRYKIAKELPIRNTEVEEKNIVRYREFAENNQLNPDMMETVFRAIIQEAVEKEASIPHPDTFLKNIAIIGGAGKMGKWMCEILSKTGHKITIIDSSLQNGSTIEDAKFADIVIVSIPISAVNEVMMKLEKCCSDETLIFDLSSLKTPASATLKRMAKTKNVCSVHPMFGPSARSMYDQNIIICDCGNPKAVEEVTKLLDNKGANIRIMDLDSHDKYMSYVLGLSHAINIAFFTALQRSNISFRDMNSVASTTFKKIMDTNKSVALEDPKLYYEIQHINANRDALWDTFSKAVEDLKKASLDQDPAKFIELMNLGKTYFDADI